MIKLGETWIRGRVTAVALGAALATTVAITGPASAAVVTKAQAPAGYVVRAHEGALPVLLADLQARHIPVVRSIQIIDAAVVRIDAVTAASLATDPAVVEVTSDVAVQLESSGYDAGSDANSAYSAAELVGAHDAWDRGYTGQGIDVALIDSGVTPVQGSPGTARSSTARTCRSSHSTRTPAHLDTFGHGTLMAGIIAGRDPGVDARLERTPPRTRASHPTPASSASRSPTPSAAATSRRSSPASTGSSSTRTTRA